MFILSGVLMRLFGNFLSVIILLMVIVIFVFACEYVFDTDLLPALKGTLRAVH